MDIQQLTNAMDAYGGNVAGTTSETAQRRGRTSNSATSAQGDTVQVSQDGQLLNVARKAAQDQQFVLEIMRVPSLFHVGFFPRINVGIDHLQILSESRSTAVQQIETYIRQVPFRPAYLRCQKMLCKVEELQHFQKGREKFDAKIIL